MATTAAAEKLYARQRSTLDSLKRHAESSNTFQWSSPEYRRRSRSRSPYAFHVYVNLPDRRFPVPNSNGQDDDEDDYIDEPELNQPSPPPPPLPPRRRRRYQLRHHAAYRTQQPYAGYVSPTAQPSTSAAAEQQPAAAAASAYNRRSHRVWPQSSRAYRQTHGFTTDRLPRYNHIKPETTVHRVVSQSVSPTGVHRLYPLDGEPVIIVPAAAMRRPPPQQVFVPGHYYGYTGYGSQAPFTSLDQIPINLAYYQQERIPRAAARYPPPQSPPEFRQPRARYAFDPPPPTRRSRTAPARLHRANPYNTQHYRSPSHFEHTTSTHAHVPPSVIAYGGDRFEYSERPRAFSGPLKYPRPVYYKRSGTAYRRKTFPSQVEPSVPPLRPQPAESFYGTARYRDEADVTGGYNRTAAFARPSPVAYAPSVTTGYAPSTRYREAHKSTAAYADYRYPVAWRYILKIIEMLFGIACIVFLTQPTWLTGFGRFVATTATQGQVVVLCLLVIGVFVSFCLLLTIQTARHVQTWRNTDASLSAFLVLTSFICGCVEAWYAACYPPYGRMYPQACSLWQWAVTAIDAWFQLLAFAVMLVYVVDLLLALRTGVSML